ncbi:D-alanine--D-alanine ligase [Flagellimonas myxillae]|uniref:D-alanine--D-alanine ligase n=1 Tax=Flagellimonas myxillae TaxID=2942214 RepID=UPI00201FAE04|nr:D-alanine--D-alanine ligase [Muricauda myxillae]MCL6268250.1 D-alanine--D-alanine ligase [Muricauda myxillae]
MKARSLFFFNAANPSMKNGGMAMESKMGIYNLIPKENIPQTIFISKNDNPALSLERVLDAGIAFPFIAKPDIGMRAFGVEKINNKDDFQRYFAKTPENFLVQKLIPYTKEVGIFYVRMPGERKGKITGIVSKEFLTVVGDGDSSVLQLIKKDPRSHLQLKALQKKFGDQLDEVLEKNEEFILVPFGSHTRGAKFVDISHKLNTGLLNTIDGICSRMDGFHYGRLDVLYNSLEELSKGEKFSIIEINGAGGEATHIYDPKHSLFFAWREITRHWNYMNRISMLNHQRGHSYLSFRDGRAMLRENGALEAQLKLI